jgi:phage terminase small subunit
VKATLTPKQEAFCLAYLETSNASEAYRRSYSAENMQPQTISVKASELLANGKVAVRLGELRKPAVKKAQMTLESHLTRLDELSRKAEDDGQYSAAINAEVARGKASGIHVEKSERVLTGPNGEPIQTVTRIELVSLSDDCED